MNTYAFAQDALARIAEVRDRVCLVDEDLILDALRNAFEQGELNGAALAVHSEPCALVDTARECGFSDGVRAAAKSLGLSPAKLLQSVDEWRRSQ